MRKFKSIGLFLAAVFLLGACASPAVEISAANFNEDKYTANLNTCRGGSALDAMLGGLGGAFAGAFVGASEGSINGALASDRVEGVIIGSIVGGTLGIFVGSYKPFSEKHESVRNCLSGKGYVMES